MKVFTISGHAQNGKDTVAGMMARKLTEQGYKVLVTHYADLLKHICRSFFGWNGEKDERGRHILQYVGTDVVRQKAPDFWVDFIISVLSLFEGSWDYVIIPDSRFPNEIDKLKQEGLNVQHIRIVRPNFISPLTPEQQKHPSEIALDNVTPDFTFVNDGTLEGLEELVAHYIKEYVYGYTD